MAFGRLITRSGEPPMSEINMTPLIDVMLVLLVIFIITAPLLGGALRLDLPRASNTVPTQTAQVVQIALDAQAQIYVDAQLVAQPALPERLQTLARIRPGAEVQVRADRNVPYGQVMAVMDAAQRVGLTRIALVAQPAGQPVPTRP